MLVIETKQNMAELVDQNNRLKEEIKLLKQQKGTYAEMKKHYPQLIKTKNQLEKKILKYQSQVKKLKDQITNVQNYQLKRYQNLNQLYLISIKEYKQLKKLFRQNIPKAQNHSNLLQSSSAQQIGIQIYFIMKVQQNLLYNQGQNILNSMSKTGNNVYKNYQDQQIMNQLQSQTQIKKINEYLNIKDNNSKFYKTSGNNMNINYSNTAIQNIILENISNNNQNKDNSKQELFYKKLYEEQNLKFNNLNEQLIALKLKILQKQKKLNQLQKIASKSLKLEEKQQTIKQHQQKIKQLNNQNLKLKQKLKQQVNFYQELQLELINQNKNLLNQLKMYDQIMEFEYLQELKNQNLQDRFSKKNEQDEQDEENSQQINVYRSSPSKIFNSLINKLFYQLKILQNNTQLQQNKKQPIQNSLKKFFKTLQSIQLQYGKLLQQKDIINHTLQVKISELNKNHQIQIKQKQRQIEQLKQKYNIYLNQAYNAYNKFISPILQIAKNQSLPLLTSNHISFMDNNNKGNNKVKKCDKNQSAQQQTQTTRTQNSVSNMLQSGDNIKKQPIKNINQSKKIHKKQQNKNQEEEQDRHVL